MSQILNIILNNYFLTKRQKLLFFHAFIRLYTITKKSHRAAPRQWKAQYRLNATKLKWRCCFCPHTLRIRLHNIDPFVLAILKVWGAFKKFIHKVGQQLWYGRLIWTKDKPLDFVNGNMYTQNYIRIFLGFMFICVHKPVVPISH